MEIIILFIIKSFRLYLLWVWWSWFDCPTYQDPIVSLLHGMWIELLMVDVIFHMAIKYLDGRPYYQPCTILVNDLNFNYRVIYKGK